MMEEKIYRNAGLYSKRNGIFEKGDYDLSDVETMTRIHELAVKYGEPVYVLREFIVVDAEYQDQPPNRCAKDWYVLEVKPE